MATKKSDFDQESYIKQVDSAHEKLKGFEGRLKHIENITDASLILKIVRKDVELRTELQNLIWLTIKNKALTGFLWLLGAAMLIPLLTFTFAKIVFKVTGLDITIL